MLGKAWNVPVMGFHVTRAVRWFRDEALTCLLIINLGSTQYTTSQAEQPVVDVYFNNAVLYLTISHLQACLEILFTETQASF